MADRVRTVNRTLQVFALLAGVGVVVLLPFDGIDVEIALSVLGIGLAALALAGFEFEAGSS